MAPRPVLSKGEHWQSACSRVCGCVCMKAPSLQLLFYREIVTLGASDVNFPREYGAKFGSIV